MADLSLAEAAYRLSVLGEKVAQECVNIMWDETPVGPSGNLRRSIRHEKVGPESYFIGTDLYYAEWVNYGRGPVRPKHTTRTGRPGKLRYYEYTPGPKSIHVPTAPPGTPVFRRGTGPAKPNNFVARAKARIRNTTFTL